MHKNAALSERNVDGLGIIHTSLVDCYKQCVIIRFQWFSPFLQAFSSPTWLASYCDTCTHSLKIIHSDTHAHTKSKIIQFGLAHFSLCRIPPWRRNTGCTIRKYSAIHDESWQYHCLSKQLHGPLFSRDQLAVGDNLRLQRFLSLWNYKVSFQAKTNENSSLRMLIQQVNYLRIHLFLSPLPPPFFFFVLLAVYLQTDTHTHLCFHWPVIHTVCASSIQPPVDTLTPNPLSLASPVPLSVTAKSHLQAHLTGPTALSTFCKHAGCSCILMPQFHSKMHNVFLRILPDTETFHWLNQVHKPGCTVLHNGNCRLANWKSLPSVVITSHICQSNFMKQPGKDVQHTLHASACTTEKSHTGHSHSSGFDPTHYQLVTGALTALAVSTVSRRFLESMARAWAAFSMRLRYSASSGVVLYCWASFMLLTSDAMSVLSTFWAISICNNTRRVLY